MEITACVSEIKGKKCHSCPWKTWWLTPVVGRVDCLLGVKCGTGLFQMLEVLFRLCQQVRHKESFDICIILVLSLNKFPHTWWLKTSHIYCLTFLASRTLKPVSLGRIKVLAGLHPLQRAWNPFPQAFQLLQWHCLYPLAYDPFLYLQSPQCSILKSLSLSFCLSLSPFYCVEWKHIPFSLS